MWSIKSIMGAMDLMDCMDMASPSQASPRKRHAHAHDCAAAPSGGWFDRRLILSRLQEFNQRFSVPIAPKLRQGLDHYRHTCGAQDPSHDPDPHDNLVKKRLSKNAMEVHIVGNEWLAKLAKGHNDRIQQYGPSHEHRYG